MPTYEGYLINVKKVKKHGSKYLGKMRQRLRVNLRKGK